MKCLVCGVELKENAKFCQACGNEVKKVEQKFVPYLDRLQKYNVEKIKVFKEMYESLEILEKTVKKVQR